MTDSDNGKKDKPKIGVYVCHCGGNISDVVDVENVAKKAGKIENVAVSRDYMFMCSNAGQKLIEDDIKELGINKVVVSACTPALHESTFRKALIRAGLNPYFYEAVNIREQCSWCHGHDHEGATAKASRLVAGGIAKVALNVELDAIRVDAVRHAAVIGAGIAGLRAALDLSQRGIEVTLIEKSPFIGGRTAQLHQAYPANDIAREILNKLIEQVTNDSTIHILLNSEVIDASGYIGDFKITVNTRPRGVTEELSEPDALIEKLPATIPDEYDYNLTKRSVLWYPYKGCYPELPAIDWDNLEKSGARETLSGVNGIELDGSSSESQINVGVIIVAVGFDHYEPKKGEYGYGEFTEVITLPQLIRLMDPDGPTGGKLSVNGGNIKNIAFIHCVGSRQVKGINGPDENGNVNDYCSRVCCTATLQAANEIAEKYPGVNITEFYQDIRAYGKGHEEMYEQASRNKVLFIKYGNRELPVVTKSDSDSSHPLLVKVVDYLSFKEEIEVPVDLVVLSVGIVPRDISNLTHLFKLPIGSDRFLQEIHPKLRPVETAIEGIVLAGTAQGPMDINESCAAASAAAVKAAMILGQGYVELSPFVSVVDENLCGGTGSCVDVCEYKGAISLIKNEIDGEMVERAYINPALCKGCGACVSVCEKRAIQINNWTLDQFEAIIEAIALDEPVAAGDMK